MVPGYGVYVLFVELEAKVQARTDKTSPQHLIPLREAGCMF